MVNDLIKKAILEKNSTKLETYRDIKYQLLLNEKSKNPKPKGNTVYTVTINGKEYKVNELVLNILQKLVKEREESISIYSSKGRKDLADYENEQLTYLKELLPAPIDDEEIEACVPSEVTKKEMGNIIKSLKEKFPTVSPKHISELIKKYLV